MSILPKSRCVFAFCLVSLIGCGSSSDNADADAGATPDGGAGYQCDPVGSDSEQGMLLNAPLATGVEVVEKEAQHPGNPGPLGLP